MKHAKLSASGSARWMTCPGSIRMEKDIPDTSSPYADEGSAAHALGELALTRGEACEKFIGQHDPEYPDYIFTKEMAEHVQVYVDYVNAITTGKAEAFIEQRVDFSDWVPEGFGTSDAIVINDGVMTVVDLKYGQGVRVDAPNNSQAMLYALGALADYGFIYEIDIVEIAIVQPRKDHISEWTIKASDLLEWAENEVKPRALEAVSDNAKLNPAPKACQFCKARDRCRALAEFNLDLISDGFDVIGKPIHLKATESLSNVELGKILPYADQITKWVKAIEAVALEQLEIGETIPGYKLVEGRSTRQWLSEEDAETAMRNAKVKVADMFTKKFISPAQAEKLLGKTHSILSEHVIKNKGKVTLAPESDKRPAIESNVTDGFEDVA